MTTYERYMAIALEEARVALAQREIPIEAVVVANGQVIGRGTAQTKVT